MTYYAKAKRLIRKRRGRMYGQGIAPVQTTAEALRASLIKTRENITQTTQELNEGDTEAPVKPEDGSNED